MIVQVQFLSEVQFFCAARKVNHIVDRVNNCKSIVCRLSRTHAIDLVSIKECRYVDLLKDSISGNEKLPWE